MITATLYDTVLEVQISGPDFNRDLLEFCAAVQKEDRAFVEYRKAWRVTNWHRYTHLPYIRAAEVARSLQLSLFGE